MAAHARNVALGQTAGALPQQAPLAGPTPAVVDGSVASIDVPAGPSTVWSSGSSSVVDPGPSTVSPGVPAGTVGWAVKGFDPATSVEDPLARSAFNSTFVNADGTATLQMSTLPVNYLDAKGGWQKIDNRLVPDGSGGWTNAANSWHVTFQPMTSTGGMTITTADGPLHFVADGAAAVAPVVEPDGTGVRYRDVLTDTDLVFEVQGGGVEELVVIKSAAGSPSVSLTVDGANFDPVAGGVVGRGVSSLAKRLSVSPPDTFDAAGQQIDPASQVFSTADVVVGRSKMAVGLTKAKLSSLPASAFPVTVDPSINLVPYDRLTAYANRTSDGAQYTSPISDGFARIGNPVIASPSGWATTRWRTVLHFDYSAAVGASALSMSMQTTFSAGSSTGATIKAFWANEWGWHPVTPPRHTTQDSPPSLAYTNTWSYPYLSQTMTTGVQTFTDHLYLIYNDLTRGLWNGNIGSADGALLLTGDDAVTSYTLKKFSVLFSLTYNRWPSTPTVSGSSPAPSHTLTWGAAVPGTDPDGDAVQYNNLIYSGSTLLYQTGWTTNRMVTWTPPSAYYGTTLTYYAQQYDGTACYQGECHVTTSAPATWVDPVNTAPNAVTLGMLPASGTFATSLQPTLSAPTVTDPNGDLVSYYFRVCDTATASVDPVTKLATYSSDPSKCVESPAAGVSGGVAGWTVPALNLIKWGHTYQWWVRTSDGVASTESGTHFWFIPSLTAVNVPAIGFGVQPNMRGVADVNTGNGNFTYTAKDLNVTGLAAPLAVTRSYNSASTTTGGFGPGWVSTWEYSLQTVTAGINVTQPDGSVLFFGHNNDGSYSPAYGDGSSIAANPTAPAQITGAAWGVTDNNKTVDYFSSAGVFLGLKTVTGRVLTVTVSGTTQTITDVASGRSIFIDWNGTPGLTASRIISVRTVPMAAYGNTPIQWRYYYNAGNQLAQACDPRNNTQTTGDCTVYSYDATPRLASVVLAKGNTQIAVTYQADGRVHTRADGYGKLWTYSYAANVSFTNLAGQPVVAAVRTTVVDPLGHSNIYDTDVALRTEHVDDQTDPTAEFDEYDANGYLYKSSDGTTITNALTDEYHYQSDGLITSKKDPTGALWTAAYDQTTSTNALIAAVDPTPVSTNVTLDSAAIGQPYIVTTTGQPQATITYTGSADPVPGVPGAVQPVALPKQVASTDGTVDTTVYDAAGDVLSTSSNTGVTTTYTYDEIGRKLSETVTWASNTATTSYSYDQLGEAATVTQPWVQNQVTGQWHQQRTTTTYDPNTNPYQVSIADIEPAGGGFTPDAARTTTAEYDLNDRNWRNTDPEGNITSVGSDDAGNQTTATDARGTVTQTVYDAENRPVQTILKGYVDPTSPGTPRDITLSSTTYDSYGRVATETDALGNVTRTDYYPSGLVQDKVRVGFVPRTGTAVDVTLEAYTYNTAGQVTVEKTANNTKEVDTTYDSAGRVASRTIKNLVTGSTVDEPTVYIYDATTGGVASESPDVPPAAMTRGTLTTYDSFGRVATRQVLNGPNTADRLVTTSGYDALGHVITVQDPNGNTTTTDYDLLGRAWRVTQPSVTSEVFNQTAVSGSPVTLTGYDTFGDVTQTEDPAGNVTTYAFDRNARPTATTYPAYTQPGTSTVLTPTETTHYDAAGSVDYRVDRRGQRTDYTYNIFNRLAITSNPAAHTGDPRGVTQTRYDDAGQVTWTQDPTGAVTQHTYDKLGNTRTTTQTIRKTSPTPDEVDVTTFDYDWAGNRILTIDPAGVSVESDVYSPAGELLASTDALGKTTVKVYDDRGLLLTDTDPEGRSTKNQYDLAGRQTSTGRYSSTNVQYTGQSVAYDHNGNKIGVTDGLGHTTTYAYDPLNRLTGVTQPVDATHTIVTGYGYDNRGLQTRTTDGNGQQWWTTYNNWGLEESRIEPSTSGQTALGDRTFTRTYDNCAGLVREDKPGGVTVTHTLDLLGRDQADDAGTAGGNRGFGYDLNNRPTTVTSGTTSVNLSYNDSGQITAASGSAGSSSFQYDTVGRMVHRIDVAGDTVYTWTPRNQLAGLADPLTASAHTFAYSNAGNVTSDTITAGANTLTRSFTYDAIGRLATDALANTSGTIRGTNYLHDANSNITKKTTTPTGALGAGDNTYTYDYASRLTSWTNPAATVTNDTYDNNGNLTQNGAVTNTYDQRNRQTQTGATTQAWTPRGTLQSASTAGIVTLYNFDGLDRMTAAGNINYTYDGLDRMVTRNATALTYSGVEKQPSADGTNTTSRDPSGNPVAASQASTAADLIADLHGDITAAVTMTGTIVGVTVYDPWGKTTAQTGTLPTGLGFQGAYTDPTTGLVDMAARWYYTGGTFRSRDRLSPSWAENPVWNRYAYANDNPLVGTDPTGLFTIPIEVGKLAHHLVEADFKSQYMSFGEIEIEKRYYVGSGRGIRLGVIDLVDMTSREFWEIKPSTAVLQGISQIKVRIEDGLNSWSIGPPLRPGRRQYKMNSIYIPLADGMSILGSISLTAKQHPKVAGLIVYKFELNIDNRLPVGITAAELIRRTLKELKNQDRAWYGHSGPGVVAAFAHAMTSFGHTILSAVDTAVRNPWWLAAAGVVALAAA